VDPIAVLRTLWQHRLVSVPILILTFASALYVFQFAPRSYESSATYAMINPDIPTQQDIVKNPDLGKLNNKNPYLRSSDPSLIVQVLLTRLNDTSMADKLKDQGLSADYTVSRGVGGINGFLVDITGIAETPEKSFATTRALGKMLENYLYDAQKVNGADDTYLFSSIVVASPDKATEQFSSRLRSLIAIFLTGVVLMFGAVSIARSVSVSRNRRKFRSQDLPEAESRRRSIKKSTSAQDSSDDTDPFTGPLHASSAPEVLGTQAKGSEDRERMSELTR
jgi:hypothetical protein